MAIPIGNLKGSFDFSDVSSYPGTGNTIYDLSAENNDLTNPTLSGTFAGSGQSKYYSFVGGTDQFYKPATSGIAGTQLFTASAFLWVRSTDWNSPAQDGGYHYLLGWGTDVAPGGGHLGFAKMQSTSFYPSGPSATMGSGWGATFFPGGLSNNTWLHLGYVVDGTDAKIYLDGVLVGSIPQDWQGANPPYFGATGVTGYIGNSGGITPWMCLGGLYSNYATASNYDIAITEFYDVPLSGTQALELFNAQESRFFGGPPPPPPLPAAIAQYDFSDVASYPGTGNTMYDLSGTGNTLNNPTLSGTFGGTGQSKYYSFTGGADQFYKDAAVGFAGTALFTASAFIWVKSSDWNVPGEGGYQYMTGWGLDTGSGGGHIGFTKKLPSSTPPFYPNVPGAMCGSGFGFTAYSSGLSNSEWYHLGYVIDGTNANLYLDGVLVGQVAQDFQYSVGLTGVLGSIQRDALYAYTPWMCLGGLYNNYATASNYDIAIAEFYNVGFASTQVLQLYNSQSARFPAPPPPPASIVGGRNFGGRFAG